MSASYNQTEWDISFLEKSEVVRSKAFGISKEAKTVKYPIRLLRYWYGYHLIREEYERKGAPIDVCEIGVDTGQMKQFAESARQLSGSSLEWSSWTAVDAIIKREKLEKGGYNDFIEVNLESPEDLPITRQYDTVILLHVLEHLFDPDAAMRKIAKIVRPGGSIIGGFPVIPNFLVKMRQEQVRKKARPMGHVSVFSPKRVREMGAQAGLETEFLTGAFFMRSKGSAIENSPAWMRMNIAFGAMFPGWPGETYWLMRKPAQ